MQDTVILFDIDYTLFNTMEYRGKVFSRLQEFFPNTNNFQEIANASYEKIREVGWFDVKKFTRELLTHISTTENALTLEKVWGEKELLASCIYPEAVGVLQALQSQSHIYLGLFSSGDLEFQKSKIATIAHLFEEKHIHIHTLKDEKVQEILQAYKNQKVIVVDDYLPVIQKIKEIDQTITVIWMKRGRFAQTFPIPEKNKPDYTIETLSILPKLIKSI